MAVRFFQNPTKGMVAVQPYIRAIYISLSETPHQIEGHIHSIAYEDMHSKSSDKQIALTFFRPKSGLPESEWLKDMLVQVIEQL